MGVLLFYVGLAGLLTLEEAGLFLLPGDISLVAAGLNGAQGYSVLAFSWIVASLGMVAGASILFHGVQRTEASSRVLPRRAIDLIHRHHVLGVFVARLVPGLRNATVFAAASARLPYRQFLYGLLPAAMLWSGALLALGWFGGAAMLAAFGNLHHSPLLKVVSFGVILAVIAFVWTRLRPPKSAGVTRRERESAS
ncbi:MAG: hypothetical protein PVSMB7_27380 [Chloroflexota bacterium]